MQEAASEPSYGQSAKGRSPTSGFLTHEQQKVLEAAVVEKQKTGEQFILNS